MKRNNDDDPAFAKRSKFDGEELLRQVASACNEKDWVKAIEIFKNAHDISPSNSEIYFWASKACDYVEDLNTSVSYIEKYISLQSESKPEGDMSLLCAYEHKGNVFEKLGLVDDAIASYEKALTYSQYDTAETLKILLNLGESYHIDKKEVDRAKGYYQQFVDISITMKWVDSSLYAEFYDDFCYALTKCDKERALQIETIVTDANAFKHLRTNAYQNWSELTAVHKEHIKRTRPLEYDNLLFGHENTKVVLLCINEIFTDATVGIIHEFLYKL